MDPRMPTLPRTKRNWLTVMMAGLLGLGLVQSPCLAASPTPVVHAAPAGLINTRIPKNEVLVYCYHDVQDEANRTASLDTLVVTANKLTAFFDWMRQNNWNPVSMQQVVDARRLGKPLPDNAVLLTFDDGLKSMVSIVLPLLKTYNYPAVFAIETGWIEQVNQRAASGITVYPERSPTAPVLEQTQDDRVAPEKDNAMNLLDVMDSSDASKVAPLYNGIVLQPKDLVSWQDLREIAASGLVEIASHSHNLHTGVLANPQGNQQPAALTRRYDPVSKTYETQDQYLQRIRADLRRSSDLIEQATGKRPRVMVWPYGAHSQKLMEVATEVGMPVNLTLGGIETVKPAEATYSPLKPWRMDRLLVDGNPDPNGMLAATRGLLASPKFIQRAVQVDLDAIYDPDPKQIDRNLGTLLDRISSMGAVSVYLQAFADPDGDGNADALYFPNRHMPMRADLFNRVAWQLRTRAGVRVYAWLPLLAFDLPNKDQQQQWSMKVRNDQQQLVPAKEDYRRLNPFLPQVVNWVGDVYEDMGINNSGVHGVLIHDDAMMTEDEQVSACDAGARWPGQSTAMTGCALTPHERTQALIDFGHQVIGRMQPHINLSNLFKVARNLYARVVLDPKAEAAYGQSLPAFLANYDEVAVMAMPWLDADQPGDPQRWMDRLRQTVARHPRGLQKVVFELQTTNWRTNQPIDDDVLTGWMENLVVNGALNMAYYPDDMYKDRPRLDVMRAHFGLNQYPYGKSIVAPAPSVAVESKRP